MANITSSSVASFEEVLQQTSYSNDFLFKLWIGRVGGFVSLISSVWLIYDQTVKRRKENKNTGSYIVIVMSACDGLASLFFFVLGSIMVPKGYAWGSFGNQATCTLQGFMTMVCSTASITYNAMLAIYFLLVVRHQWGRNRFDTVCSRFWFLVFPLAWTILFGTLVLLDGAFDFSPARAGVGCFINPSPIGCVNYSDIVGECKSGNSSDLFRLVTLALITITAIIIAVSINLLWRYIRTTEKKLQQYSFERNNPSTATPTRTPGTSTATTRSMQAAKVGCLYCGCFIISFFSYVIVVIYALNDTIPPKWIVILNFTFQSLQGFFNTLVYIYRRRQS